MIFQANVTLKQGGKAVFIYNKTDFEEETKLLYNDQKMNY